MCVLIIQETKDFIQDLYLIVEFLRSGYLFKAKPNSLPLKQKPASLPLKAAWLEIVEVFSKNLMFWCPIISLFHFLGCSVKLPKFRFFYVSLFCICLILIIQLYLNIEKTNAWHTWPKANLSSCALCRFIILSFLNL